MFALIACGVIVYALVATVVFGSVYFLISITIMKLQRDPRSPRSKIARIMLAWLAMLILTALLVSSMSSPLFMRWYE